MPLLENQRNLGPRRRPTVSMEAKHRAGQTSGHWSNPTRSKHAAHTPKASASWRTVSTDPVPVAALRESGSVSRRLHVTQHPSYNHLYSVPQPTSANLSGSLGLCMVVSYVELGAGKQAEEVQRKTKV